MTDTECVRHPGTPSIGTLGYIQPAIELADGRTLPSQALRYSLCHDCLVELSGYPMEQVHAKVQQAITADVRSLRADFEAIIAGSYTEAERSKLAHPSYIASLTDSEDDSV